MVTLLCSSAESWNVTLCWLGSQRGDIHAPSHQDDDEEEEEINNEQRLRKLKKAAGGGDKVTQLDYLSNLCLDL